MRVSMRHQTKDTQSLVVISFAIGDQFFGECLEKEELTVQNQVREDLLYDLGYGNTTITLSDIKRQYPKTFPKEWTDNN